MFFSRIALFALPAIAFAAVLPRDDGINSCAIGASQYCCNSYQAANSMSAGQKAFLGLAGFSADNAIGQVGFDCNPISGAGAGAGGAAAFGAAGCNNQAACCQKTAANGFLAINCNPITGNL